MSDIVIRAEGLGKKYLIGHETKQTGDNTFRDTIMQGASRMKRSVGDIMCGRPLVVGDEVEEFWALKDVDFEIRRGEVVGIIGRNGAGKSTLLKVLSRITEPTEGRVTIEGRVASLLEVGTGFHPELSGRENIFLNGAILGMTRKEIRAKFDEIVDFAGVEKFVDTPVKRYSSGMKVRLGFSVAAHLEPEVLIVDEVLAVGDAEFQKRCLGKMQDVAVDGRTVLFVSHNMSITKQLCQKGIFLIDGKIAKLASMNDTIACYVGDTKATKKIVFTKKDIHANLFLTEEKSKYEKSDEIGITLEITLDNEKLDFHAGYAIFSHNSETPLWWSFFGDATGLLGAKTGNTKFSTRIPSKTLNDGKYEIELILATHGVGWISGPGDLRERIAFEVSGGVLGSTLLTGTSRPTLLFPIIDWSKSDE